MLSPDADRWQQTIFDRPAAQRSESAESQGGAFSGCFFSAWMPRKSADRHPQDIAKSSSRMRTLTGAYNEFRRRAVELVGECRAAALPSGSPSCDACVGTKYWCCEETSSLLPAVSRDDEVPVVRKRTSFHAIARTTRVRSSWRPLPCDCRKSQPTRPDITCRLRAPAVPA